MTSVPQAAAHVVGEDGVRGLLCRGLGTRLMANVMQAALFSFLLFSLFIFYFYDYFTGGALLGRVEVARGGA